MCICICVHVSRVCVGAMLSEDDVRWPNPSILALF